ncbi:MAG: SIMPL domain-containing protein [Burkholderia sp.]|jgi:uncharacterized protein
MSKKKIAAAAAALALAAAGAPALAADSCDDDGVRVTVRGEASQTIANDEATVTFSAEEQKDKAADAIAAATKRGNAAQDALKKFGDRIEVKTADFSTWPVYTRPKEGEAAKVAAWGARETLQVKVKDVKAVSEVMAAAAEHLNYDGVTFTLSRKAQKAQGDALLREAVDDAMRQVRVMAESIGRKGSDVRVVSMSVNHRSGGTPRYYAASRNNMVLAASAKSAPVPQVSAGSSEVTLSVSLEARIKDK